MASILKRKDRKGTKYRVIWRDAGGTQHSKTFEKYKDATEHRGKVEQKRPRASAGKISLARAMECFIEDREATRSTGTVATYKTTLPAFRNSLRADLLLPNVKPGHVAAYRNERRKDLASKTVNNHLRQLSCFFNWCIRQGYIEDNPASPKVVEWPKFKRKVPEWLDEEQSRTLMATVESDCPDLTVRVAVMLGLRAGMRLGEIAALRWSDVRFDNNVLTIQKESKSKDPRMVPMHADVRVVLESLPRAGDYVLPCERIRNPDKPVMHANSNALGLRTRTWLKGHGFDVGVHGLRHSYATQMAALGATEKDLKDLLGHVTPDTTRLYIQSRPDRMQDLVALLGA